MLLRRWTAIGTKLATLALVGGLGAASSSCSLIVDHDADQCQADKDCEQFAGTSCQSGVCVAAACMTIADCSAFPGTICNNMQCVPAGEGCTKTADCINSEGDYHICRKDTGTCVGLQTAQCSTVIGDWTNDNAVIFGAVIPLTGNDSKTGLALVDSLKLAQQDFNRVNDLPPAPSGSGQRPVVFVACDDASDSDTAEVSAHHLVDEVGVQAIMGAAFSGISIAVATDVTIPAGVLLFSPSATSTAITVLPDHGLVWRTSPSDIYQSAALKRYVPDLEKAIRTERTLCSPAPCADEIKLDILFKGDAYGNGLEKALLSAGDVLQLNGADANNQPTESNFNAYDYGNPDDPMSDPPKYAQRVAEVVADQPDIILVLGTTEGVTDLFEKIENQWTGTFRPRWVFSDGGEVPDLYEFIKGNDSLRTRVTGTVPGTNNINFQTFRSYYTGTWNDGTTADTFGTAGAYDIAYLLSYSVVALRDQPLTGANFNTALGTFFESGQKVNAGDDPTTAFQQLQAGNAIDFDGASGSLKFDPNTGEAPSDIQIWCVTKDANGKANGERNSTLYYSADSNQLVGSISAAVCGN